MPSAPIPVDEASRLRALSELDVLDSAPDAEFDALVLAAAAVCETPISLISLIDEDRQWFKANIGLPGVAETPRDVAFCAHAILDDGILEVPDATRDPRFADNALITGDPKIRFYAGATLRLSDGARVGTLCVIDRKPRHLDARQREVLGHLATAAVKALEGRRALKAERHLRETAARAAAVLRNSIDAIVTLSLDSTVTHWNTAAEKLFDYGPDEMVGRSIDILIPPDRRGDVRDLATRLAERPTGVNYDAVLMRKSGEPIAVSVSLAPISGPDGRITGATKIIRDTREQTLAAQTLATSEARFRALSDASPLGVFATDAFGACTYTNARWQEIYGLTLDQSLGDGWASTLHPEDRAASFTEWQRTATRRIEFDMEFRILHPGGGIRYVHSRAKAIVGPDGMVSGYVGSVEDVTERRLIGLELRQEHERLEAIIEGTGAGTWEWNIETGETRFSERWAAMVGWDLAELTPTSVDTRIGLSHPEELARSRELVQRHLEGETDLYEFEGRLRHRAGHWVWIRERGRVTTRGPDGGAVFIHGVLEDITVRKQQEQALQRSEQLLNRTGEVAGVGGWELDLGVGIPVWSAQTRRIYGVGPEYQPTLAAAIDFYAPEARPVIQAAIENGIASGQGWDVELPFIQAGGHRIWVRAIGHAEYDGGQPVRLFGTFQDVTERVRQGEALQAANQRFALATESGGIGVWDLDIESRTSVWNPQMGRLYGLPESAEPGGIERWAQRLYPDDRAAAEQALREAIAGARDFDSEFRIVWDDGSVHHIRAAARLIRDDNGRPRRLIGVNWDITPLRVLAEELAEQHEMLRVTLQSIGDAVITTDATGTVTWLNPVAERMTGWLVGEAQGRPLNQVFHIVNEETRQPTENPVEACLQRGIVAGLASHTVLISRGGEEHGIEDSAAPIRNQQGDLLGVVLVFHDVTEQRRLSGEMTHRATHDALTGLVNRGEFETRLQRTLDKSQEEHSEHALLFIDLDQFKLVNDACGHTAGDHLLQQVAGLLTETVRTRDTLARLGGDEFAVILEHCTSDNAQRVAQQICDRMDDFRFVHDGQRFRIGTSIGLVPLDDRWSTTAAVMQAADTSCYAAKEAGRNRVHAWFDTDAAMRARHGEMQWATRLEQALDEDRFVLHAQRIFPVRAEPAGLYAEVLLRMVDNVGGLVAPGAFLPAAERFHLSSRIDRWVLRHAIDLLIAQPDLSTIDTLCVNLSGQSVGDRAFHRQAIETLTDAGAAVCRVICLEITETAAVTNMADAALFIEQARALGIRIALDDFGAGASSFGYLKSLAVDVLKIDGQFVKDMIDDPLDDAAVRCFVDVARVVGVKTVAEFVDTPAVLARLKEIGVDYAQGFLLHRPEPIEHVLRTNAGDLGEASTINRLDLAAQASALPPRPAPAAYGPIVVRSSSAV